MKQILFKRNWVVLSAATLLTALPFSLAAQAAPSAQSLLAAMAKAENTVSLSGTEVMERDGSPSLKMRVWRDGARRRVEFLEPPVRRGDVIVDNGQNVWIYHRAEQTAVQTRSSASVERLQGNLARMGRRFESRVAGESTVAGRKTWIVEIAPRGSKQAVRRFFIDQNSKAVLRHERYVGANRVESSVFQSVATTDVPASRFNWNPPQGAKVTRTSGTLFPRLQGAKRAAAWLQSPAFVPSSYAFESAIVDNTKGEAWLRFSSGSERFSIFQQRDGDGIIWPPKALPQGLFWQRGGSRFLVVGAPSDAAGRVAESVK
ncbi:MAG TPA: sigma-E factor regulatory protein RseB domain-containing protein [Abditibacteriaceae bacterium]|jgi:outer membrane lipoprotein-sorting protein